jgi:hypothetical protein
VISGSSFGTWITPRAVTRIIDVEIGGEERRALRAEEGWLDLGVNPISRLHSGIDANDPQQTSARLRCNPLRQCAPAVASGRIFDV